MKVSNLDIWEAVPALAELNQLPWSDVKISYWLAKLARKLRSHHQDIDQVRATLVQRYASPNEQGQLTVERGTPAWDEFARAFSELLAVETELDVQIVHLPLAPGFPLKPAILAPLLPFIEFDGLEDLPEDADEHQPAQPGRDGRGTPIPIR